MSKRTETIGLTFLAVLLVAMAVTGYHLFTGESEVPSVSQ